MRPTALILMSFVFASNAMASDLVPGSFRMFGTTTPNTGCEIGTSLVLDKGQISGDVVLLKEFVMGFCEIYAVPNQRFFAPKSVEEDGCGSVVIKGSIERNGSREVIEIVDNRARVCKDVIPALVVMTVKDQAKGTEYTSYSNDVQSTPEMMKIPKLKVTPNR